MEPNKVMKDDICEFFVQRCEYIKGRYFDGGIGDPHGLEKFYTADDPKTLVKMDLLK